MENDLIPANENAVKDRLYHEHLSQLPERIESLKRLYDSQNSYYEVCKEYEQKNKKIKRSNELLY